MLMLNPGLSNGGRASLSFRLPNPGLLILCQGHRLILFVYIGDFVDARIRVSRSEV
jgi:hypothetical protein